MNTQLLEPRDLDRAAEIIRSGIMSIDNGQSVYDLGADGMNKVAGRSIFHERGKPQHNLRILYISEDTWLERDCEDIS